MSKSKIFFCFCLSFIGGIFLSSINEIPQPVQLGVLVLGIFLISVLWKYKKMAVIGFCILFLVLGIWRHQEAQSRIVDSGPSLNGLNDSNREVVLTGVISSEPAIGEKTLKLRVKTVLITVGRFPEYKYGDKLEITGLLKTPSEDIDGFNYRNYLQKEGIYSVMDFPKIELLGRGFGNPVMDVLFSFKNKFKEIAGNFISPPEVGILEALVFGDEGKISQEWKDKLNITGTRHIAAVSGMNITIIASLILSFVLSLGLWRRQAFYLTIFLLVIFILMIGAPASAVRAGIMAAVLMLAQHLGRLQASGRAVIFAAVLMLFLNPLLLKFDIGFQLSFLAVLGMIYLQPFFSDFLKKIPDPVVFPLRAALSATLSAQVFTLPILIYNFGRVSLISPITNILIVPLLAPLTVLIFIFGFAGLIFWAFGWILSWPVWLFLSYIVKIIDWSSRIPWASVFFKEIHWIWLMIFYLILGFMVWRLQESQKLKFLKY